MSGPARLPLFHRLPAQHLLAAAVCLGLAASLAAKAPVGAWMAMAGIAALAALPQRELRSPLLAVAMLLTGWVWGSLRLTALDESVLLDRAGSTGLARVEVTGPARTTEFETRVPVKVLRFGALALDERARLDLPRGRSPPQGSILDVVAGVQLPSRPDDEGDFDETAYLRRQGIHVVLAADDFTIVGQRGGVGGLADSLRRAVASSLAPGVSGERRAVIAGIVLGEDEGLERGLREDFQASGLYHLLAVSGQNVAYVVIGAIVVAWLLGVTRAVGQAAALLSVFGYVLAVGWQPSVVRAGVAGGLASLAWLCGRARDRWYFLLVGAAVLLAWNPYSLLEAGFQLSFAAVAAIFVLVPRLEARLEGFPLPARLVSVLAVSGACGVATAPILMTQFERVPVYAVASNALAAPVVPPLLGLGLLCAALDPLLPAAAGALAWVNGWLAAYLAAVARLFAGLPHAELTSWTALAGVAAAFALVFILMRLPPPRGRRAFVLVVLLALVVAGWRLLPNDRPDPPEGLRITFLDVGQGDAVLLEVPQGAVLVDQGPPEAHVADQIRELGIRRLAAVVLTHPQRDHVGGAAEVLREVRVEVALDPGIPAASPEQDAAEAAAAQSDVRIALARAGDSFRLGALTLRVLWPDDPGLPGEDPNRRAVVLLASYGSFDGLLTADAESEVTVPLHPPAVELLKVAHHGSADDRLDSLLELVQPRVAVISVGRGNDYGHPHPSTIAALARYPDLALYRTDTDGSVVVESDGREFAVTSER
jgi:competence protein ComEC